MPPPPRRDTKAVSVKKKNGAASPVKKTKLNPMASQQNKKQQEKAMQKNKGQPEDSKGEDEEEKPKKTEQQEFKSAANEVARKKGFIRRLEAARDALAEKLKDKMKEYSKQIRAAEKELEDLEEKAKAKRKAVQKVQKVAQMAKAAHLAAKLEAKKVAQMAKAANLAAKLEAKANRVAAGRLLASKALKAAKERKEQLSAKLEERQAKAGEYKAAFERAKAEYDSAVKQCKLLKANGEYVPEEGWKDYSAPFAYKPPGVKAFLDMTAAKEKWAKAKAVWDKLSEDMQQREERAQAAVGRFKEVQLRRKAVEEKKEELDSALTGVLKKLKPKDKLRIKECQGSLNKVIKIHQKKK